MNYYEAVKNRRSNYTITNKSPISNNRIEGILRDAMAFVPSAFDSQSSRAVLFLNEKHTKLWSIVKETLRKIVPANKFSTTEEKIDSFSAGYGTILFYEDMDTVSELQVNFPSYAANFPIWSNQSGGMLQFAVWTALCSEGFGVSLQHYNPIIDAETAQEFSVPTSWKMLAQMPFGVAETASIPLQRNLAETRLIILGDKK